MVQERRGQGTGMCISSMKMFTKNLLTVCETHQQSWHFYKKGGSHSSRRVWRRSRVRTQQEGDQLATSRGEKPQEEPNLPVS